VLKPRRQDRVFDGRQRARFHLSIVGECVECEPRFYRFSTELGRKHRHKPTPSSTSLPAFPLVNVHFSNSPARANMGEIDSIPPSSTKFWHICPAQGICAFLVRGVEGGKRAAENAPATNAPAHPQVRSVTTGKRLDVAPCPGCALTFAMSAAKGSRITL
jgi:hypothetical protein